MSHSIDMSLHFLRKGAFALLHRMIDIPTMKHMTPNLFLLRKKAKERGELQQLQIETHHVFIQTKFSFENGSRRKLS